LAFSFCLFLSVPVDLNSAIPTRSKQDKSRQKPTQRERQTRMNAASHPMPPTPALRRLADFLRETGSALSVREAATMAINQWIAAERGQFTRTTPTPTRGYQWKTLFLPDGTELRVVHAGQAYHARVEGDEILYRQRPVSPRQFIQAVAGEGRNAWRDVSILLPGQLMWRAASLLRRQAGAEEVPKPVSAAEAMQAAAACMSETLKHALTLVELANTRSLPPYERRSSRQRREECELGETCGFD
jgi:hypothetical protein